MRLTQTSIRLLIVILLIGAALATARPARAGSSITVNDTGDTAAADNKCTLREAVIAANTNTASGGGIAGECVAGGSGTDTISFSIGSGLHTITLGSELDITAPVIIDGSSQPGFSAGSPGDPMIAITGSIGILLNFQTGSTGSSVKNLRLVNSTTGSLSRAVQLGVGSFTVTGNYFNTDGTSSLGGDDTVGVILDGAVSSTIGGSTSAERNLFGGHTGIRLDNGSGDTIRNNYFGVTPTGNTALGSLPTDNDAINIGYYSPSSTCANNVVRDNVITGFYEGVFLGLHSHDTLVAGNRVGVGADGATKLPNGRGIMIDGADSNTIGGTSLLDRNVLSGNLYNISVEDNSSNSPDNNVIEGNYIGVRSDGLNRVSAYGDGTADYNGIRLLAGDNTLIGGTAAGSGNLISGNYIGVYLPSGATNTKIRGNMIGTDSTGSLALIQAYGIDLAGGSADIGNVSTPGNNLVSGNDGGIFLFTSTGSTIYGNRIGLKAAGNFALPNNYGIYLTFSSSATIAQNWIGYSTHDGIFADITSGVSGGSSDNCFTFNATYGVESANTGYTALVLGNWWNKPTGPYHPSVNPAGTGDAISDYVLPIPWYTKAPATCRRSPSDFDGDGSSDGAKFTASGTLWDLQSATGTWDGKFVGTDGSYIPRSDFDGDGKTDPAKFVTDTIWYFGSSDSTWHGVYIGSDGTPISGSDFDGDGKTDPAKFVSGTIWYFGSGDSTWHGVYIGNDGTQITGSDFDGDGKTDPAKFVAGTIWYFGSADSTWHGVYIGSDGSPISGSDFDGDGQADPAKFVTNTVWYFGSSDHVWHGIYIGSDGTPVTGCDFDGDGKTDAAKFVGGTTLWYLKSSSSTWDGRYLGGDTYSLAN